jgi:endo-alpha-1,4-polygalactosaminidase (GH114 family)
MSMKSESIMATPKLLTVPANADRPVFEGSAKAERLGLDVPVVHEETLVADDRSALSPAQTVESKLTRMLKEATLPVSHLQMRGLLRSR